jgi:hypothetical protein
VLDGAATADGSASSGSVAARGLSRRALLAASAAALPLLVTACRGVQALGTPPPPPAAVRALEAAITAEAAMIARYAAALKQLTAGGFTAASAVQADHIAHLAQLRSRLVEPPGARPSPVNPPHGTPSAGPGAAGAAGTTGATGVTGTRAVLGELEIAEQGASDRLIGELAGLPPSLAQLFASIAASEATHAEYLRAQRRVR